MYQKPFSNCLSSCPCCLREDMAAVCSVLTSCWRVSLDYRAKRPCIDGLKLNDFVKR